MKRMMVFPMLELCNMMKGGTKNTKFLYGLLKNIKKLEAEAELVKTLDQPSAAVVEFEEKRIALCVQLSKKDDGGNPIIENNAFVVENAAEFQQKLAELRAEYRSALEENDKRQRDIHALVHEELELDLVKVSIEELPQELSAEQLEILWPMIKD